MHNYINIVQKHIMKILFANINDAQPIPPPEDVIRADTYVSVPLALEMKKRGHEVSFLCPTDSTIGVKRIYTSTPSLFSIISSDEFFSISNPQLRTAIIMSLQFDLYTKLIEVCKKRAFDVIHLHTNNPLAELTITQYIGLPIIMTVHGTCTYPEEEGRIKKFFKSSNAYFVSITDYQRTSFKGLRFIKTIYNGLQLEKFPFAQEAGQTMLFAGRLRKQKGIKEAVDAAEQTGKMLEITGSLSMDAGDRSYFQEYILSKKNIFKYYGLTPRSKLGSFYRRSKITLFPIQWEEPFGLVLIESMASGTPIIAFARGSVPEVIQDGQTGFIINPSNDDIRGNWIIKKTGIEGFVEAINKIYAMPEEEYKKMRQNCRAHVEKHFTVERMVDEYEKIYEKIIAKKRR